MSAHITHAMHTHSLESYRKAKASLSARAAAVCAWIVDHGPATDRQVMAGLGFADPNTVRPRITELIDARLLIETGKRIENGRHVRIVGLAPINAVRQQESLFHAH